MEEQDYCRAEDLKFHSSWDWLMPVVEKCIIGEAEQPLQARILINKIYENLCSINITGTYKEVIEFIKWYNKQNKINYV